MELSMRLFLSITLITFVALTGCRGKQADTAALQKQYTQAHKQYVDDCVMSMTSGAGNALSGKSSTPPTPQQEAAQQKKCEQEAKRAGDLQKQLQVAPQ
jgi:hypothetical protein